MSSDQDSAPTPTALDVTRDRSSREPGRSLPASAPPSVALQQLVDRIPEGWSTVAFEGRRYAMTRTSRVDGRSVKVYAEELGGSDLISANIYKTSSALLLRSCEIPDAKVLAFLRGWMAEHAQPPGAVTRQAAEGGPRSVHS